MANRQRKQCPYAAGFVDVSIKVTQHSGEFKDEPTCFALSPSEEYNRHNGRRTKKMTSRNLGIEL